MIETEWHILTDDSFPWRDIHVENFKHQCKLCPEVQYAPHFDGIMVLANRHMKNKHPDIKR